MTQDSRVLFSFKLVFHFCGIELQMRLCTVISAHWSDLKMLFTTIYTETTNTTKNKGNWKFKIKRLHISNQGKAVIKLKIFKSEPIKVSFQTWI